MARSKTSLGWLKRHVNDPYVKQAQKDGYRSRASYKLLEIQEKYKLIRPGMSVVDLGAAPGGWSQVTSRLIGGQGSPDRFGHPGNGQHSGRAFYPGRLH